MALNRTAVALPSVRATPHLERAARRIPWDTVAAVALILAFFFLLQFSTDALVDRDGYFHIKFSQLMRERGFIHSLPWLQYTIHRDYYRDHHFLQHVLYLPFTFGDLVFWGKVASALFASLAAICFYGLLRSCKVEFPWLWLLLYLAASPAFLYRTSMLRVQSISLAMMFLAIGFLIHKRYKSLFALAFAFVWLYDAFPFLLIIAAMFFVCDLGPGRRADRRPLAYVSAGLLAGMVINPFFPANVGSYLFNLNRISSSDPASWIGNEWRPYTTLAFAQESWVALAVLFGTIVMLLGRSSKRSRVVYALFGVSLFFLALLMRSRRFIEYWPAFAVLFSAFAWSDLRTLAPAGEAWKRMRLRRRGAVALAAAAACACVVFSYHGARAEMRGTIGNQQYKGAALWLKEHTEPGTLVFNTDWDDFSQLFFYNDANHYIAGLDPNYMRKYDDGLYRKWQDITKGRIPDPHRAIVDHFKARYVVTDNSHHRFLQRAAEDRHMVVVYRDDFCSVYAISESGKRGG